MTVNELLSYCIREARSGNGNKEIFVADDDEGNGYHKLLYEFCTYDELTENGKYASYCYGLEGHNNDTCIILG
jgi:hypothetical protein